MSTAEASENPPNFEYVAVERHVLQDNIILIDAKSGILMTLSGLLIVHSLDQLFRLIPELRGSHAMGHSAFVQVSLIAASVFYVVSLLGLFSTVFFTWYVVKPRLVTTNDLIYWGSDVFLYGEQNYASKIEAATQEDIRANFLGHLYVLAGICRNKYKYFSRATRWAEVSLVATLAAEIARFF